MRSVSHRSGRCGPSAVALQRGSTRVSGGENRGARHSSVAQHSGGRERGVRIRCPAVPDPVVVYTDGACSGNPGPGGWAWAVAPDGTPSAAGGEVRTTNQRMEITAALEAVRTFSGNGPVVVVSDSTYVVNC